VPASVLQQQHLQGMGGRGAVAVLEHPAAQGEGVGGGMEWGGGAWGVFCEAYAEGVLGSLLGRGCSGPYAGLAAGMVAGCVMGHLGLRQAKHSTMYTSSLLPWLHCSVQCGKALGSR
jgi:hypothetical protein